MSESAEQIDFNATGELFQPTRLQGFKRAPVAYKRFDRAAEAVRYAVEEMPPELLAGAFLEVEEERFDGAGIRALYDSPAYPLPRGPLLRGAVHRK